MTNLFISIHRISIKCKIYTFNLPPIGIVSRMSKNLITPYFTWLYSIFINMVCPITPFCPISRKITILHTRKVILIRKKAATKFSHGNPTIPLSTEVNFVTAFFLYPITSSLCIYELSFFTQSLPMQEIFPKILGFLFPGH